MQASPTFYTNVHLLDLSGKNVFNGFDAVTEINVLCFICFVICPILLVGEYPLQTISVFANHRFNFDVHGNLLSGNEAW